MSQQARKAAAKFQDLDGAAVVWEPDKSPRVVESGRYVYNVCKITHEATSISKETFDENAGGERGQRDLTVLSCRAH